MSFPTTISGGWSKKLVLKSLKTISKCLKYIATNISTAPEACGHDFFDDGLTFVTNEFALDREGGTMLIREAIKIFSRLHIDDTTPEQIVSDTVNSY